MWNFVDIIQSDTNNNTKETQINTHKQLNSGKFHKKGR